MQPREVEGMYSEAEGAVLQVFARKVPAHHVIVEIGSHRGRSTAFLAKGSAEGNGAHIYAIDPWEKNRRYPKYKRPDNFPAFCENLEACGLREFVTPITGWSHKVARGWNKPVGLLHIDGDHSFRSALRDFQLWQPFVSIGGIVIFHDYHMTGVRRAVEESGLRGGSVTETVFVWRKSRGYRPVVQFLNKRPAARHERF